MNTVTATRNPARDRLVRNIVLAVGLLIIAAFVYGSGMRDEIRKARVVNEQRKVAQQEYRDAQRKLRLRLATMQQLEARRQVALALDALDKRNFGTAQDDLKRASALLDQAQAADTSNPDLSAASATLKQTNLVAAADMGAQRDALVGLAATLDKAFDAATPALIDAAAQDDAAHPIKPVTMNDVPEGPDADKGADLTNGQEFRK